MSSSSPNVSAALAALGSNPLQMLQMIGGLQALQNTASLQQLQQFAILQQGHVAAAGNQLNPQAQFFLQNQVKIYFFLINCSFVKFRTSKLVTNNYGCGWFLKGFLQGFQRSGMPPRPAHPTQVCLYNCS